jgi:hypothetical protein
MLNHEAMLPPHIIEEIRRREREKGEQNFQIPLRDEIPMPQDGPNDQTKPSWHDVHDANERGYDETQIF